MNNPNDITRLKHLDSLASHVNVLGSASSTVDGGLWYGVVDGLPVVKMNHGGDEFILDTRPADDALIGNKLYLGGHIFKLTGFADGLTFSDNNFYAADTVVGSVSNFAFQFTYAGALSVAVGDTISIAQLDTDAVNLSLDLDSLNTTPTPWSVAGRGDSYDSSGTYTYTTGTTATYNKKGTAEYSYSQATQHTLTFNIAVGLTPDKNATIALLLSNVNTKQQSAKYNALVRSPEPTFPVTLFEEFVKVTENYDASGNLESFDVFIMSDDAIYANNERMNDGVPFSDQDGWLNTFSVSADVPVNLSFAEGLTAGKAYQHEYGKLEEVKNGDISTGYKFTTDKFVAGYKETTTNDTTTYTYTFTYIDSPSIYWVQSTAPHKINGDYCTIEGLAQGLTIAPVENENYKYTIYKGSLSVGTIDKNIITITDKAAFVNNDPETAQEFTVKVTDTQGTLAENNGYYFAYEIVLGDALINEYKTEGVDEGFTYNSTTQKYTYHMGTIGRGFSDQTKEDNNREGKLTSSYTFTPEETFGDTTATDTLTLSGTGLVSGKEFKINQYDRIYFVDNETNVYIGKIDRKNKTVNLNYNASRSGIAENDTISITGGYTFAQDCDVFAKFFEKYIARGGTSTNRTFRFFANNFGYGGFIPADNYKSATYCATDSYKEIYLTPPEDYYILLPDSPYAEFFWHSTDGTAADIKIGEFDGKTVTLNSHAFDNTPTTDTITINEYVYVTPVDISFALATDSDTLAISRTFDNETFTTGATAGTYTYTATGSTAGWCVSGDETQIFNSVNLQGKTFTIENLRIDLGNLGFDSQGYIHATNGSTIGRMGGNVIKLYDTAVHKLATPILTGADAADFTLILPT